MIMSNVFARDDMVLFASSFGAALSGHSSGRDWIGILPGHSSGRDWIGSCLVLIWMDRSVIFLRKREAVNCSLYDFMPNSANLPYQMQTDMWVDPPLTNRIKMI